jgi:hypothetical protein
MPGARCSHPSAHLGEAELAQGNNRATSTWNPIAASNAKGAYMFAKSFSAPVILAMLLGGCGTMVPEIQENPWAPGDGQLMVQAIVQSVRCEIIDALRHLRESDVKNSQQYNQQRVTDFLLKWGVQMTLTLTIDERSSVAPSILWTPLTPISTMFSLSGGASGTADSTRTDKLSFYYQISDILKHDYCTTGVQQGNEGSLLVQSDLKLEEWLADYTGTLGTHEGLAPTSNSGVLKDNVLSHDIKFDITTSGNLTPGWKLKRASINSTGTFFSTSRDRTHDLIITMGPGDKTGLTGAAAQNADQAQQISNAVTTGFKNAVTP